MHLEQAQASVQKNDGDERADTRRNDAGDVTRLSFRQHRAGRKRKQLALAGGNRGARQSEAEPGTPVLKKRRSTTSLSGRVMMPSAASEATKSSVSAASLDGVPQPGALISRASPF
jgi:hypothetical protein